MLVGFHDVVLKGAKNCKGIPQHVATTIALCICPPLQYNYMCVIYTVKYAHYANDP